MSIVDIPVEDAGALEAVGSEVRGDFLRRLLRSPMFLIGATVLLIWIVCASWRSWPCPRSSPH